MSEIARDWKRCVELKEHYDALGITEITLMNLYRYNTPLSDEDFDRGLPWEYVTDVKPAGSIRHGVEVDLNFEAAHPSGLTFLWSFYIENRDRLFGVTGGPALDYENIKKVARRLPPPMLLKLQDILRKNVGAMRKQQQEAWEYYSKVASSADFAENFVVALGDLRND